MSMAAAVIFLASRAAGAVVGGDQLTILALAFGDAAGQTARSNLERLDLRVD